MLMSLGDSSTIFGSEPRFTLWPAKVVAEEAFALLLRLMVDGGCADMPMVSRSFPDDAPPLARKDSLKFKVDEEASAVPAEVLKPLFRNEEKVNLPLLPLVAALLLWLPPAAFSAPLELPNAPPPVMLPLLALAIVAVTFSAGREDEAGCASGLHQRSSESFNSITNGSNYARRRKDKNKNTVYKLDQCLGLTNDK